ncbi:amidase signature enzyme [Dothidotthia symphoricarpi CBS 119687]|uniref:Amidase signature enzyme n=1 Tax=Dothidotthia symphoricarpi CBS 119687 TaxID=1392245 RepID=A0A6A6A645_9PLEO|nr:amidase signature enzyme [Dothidotthia symphoricarpi CBS 119687]KAF2127452.1 amidase signature enzyme [Dothidotthia symphoricarpi CBS 119687]
MQHNIPLLSEITLPDIYEGLDNGLFTSVDLVNAYLARIQEVDHEYNSVIQTSSNALRIAQSLDAERQNRGSRGPLHGLPILLKDNIPTLDCTETTCGSLALLGCKPPDEAVVVTGLRKAGAVILGKANMAEWAGFRSTNGCSGWSPRGGQMTGIFWPGMKSSGSSTGSAIATALGLCFAAVGTETCYSITAPAEKCGIIGFKPSRDVLPSEGIIYASQRQDTVGLLTRTVDDAVLMCMELVPQCGNQLTERQLQIIQHTQATGPSLDLTGIRIGIPRGLRETQDIPACKQEAFEGVIQKLKVAGAQIVNFWNLKGAKEFEGLSQAERHIVLDTDMKIAINAYLGSLTVNPKDINTLYDLIGFLKICPEEEFSKWNVEALERAQATHPSHELYQRMLKRDIYFAGEGGIRGALDRYNCDVLLIPTLSVTMQTFAARAGSPVMSVPMGVFPEETAIERDPKNGMVTAAPGIPFSGFVFGRVGRDEDVLKVGYVFEQLTMVRNQLKPYLEPQKEIEDVKEPTPMDPLTTVSEENMEGT